jgi:ribosome maturation factor RimP
MGRPFKVARQYQKHIGRLVELVLADGSTVQGQLVDHADEQLSLRIQHPSKVKGRLPKLDDEVTLFRLAGIKATKAIIKFN